MSATHELKTWPQPFGAILDGSKTYEIRKDDRGFSAGDTLRLREFDAYHNRYTGRSVDVRVTYKTAGGQWGLPDDLCVLAIQRATPAAPSASASEEVATLERVRARLVRENVTPMDRYHQEGQRDMRNALLSVVDDMLTEARARAAAPPPVAAAAPSSASEVASDIETLLAKFNGQAEEYARQANAQSNRAAKAEIALAAECAAHAETRKRLACSDDDRHILAAERDAARAEAEAARRAQREAETVQAEAVRVLQELTELETSDLSKLVEGVALEVQVEYDGKRAAEKERDEQRARAEMAEAALWTIAKAIGVSEDRAPATVAEDVKLFVQRYERSSAAEAKLAALEAPVAASEAFVEECARASFDGYETDGGTCTSTRTWEMLTEATRDEFRHSVRAVVALCWQRFAAAVQSETAVSAFDEAFMTTLDSPDDTCAGMRAALAVALASLGANSPESPDGSNSSKSSNGSAAAPAVLDSSLDVARMWAEKVYVEQDSFVGAALKSIVIAIEDERRARGGAK